MFNQKQCHTLTVINNLGSLFQITQQFIQTILISLCIGGWGRLKLLHAIVQLNSI